MCCPLLSPQRLSTQQDTSPSTAKPHKPRLHSFGRLSAYCVTKRQCMLSCHTEGQPCALACRAVTCCCHTQRPSAGQGTSPSKPPNPQLYSFEGKLSLPRQVPINALLPCRQATQQHMCVVLSPAVTTEAFSRAGYFTIDCEAPNPRLYSFEGAICCWDIPPTHQLSRRPPIGAQYPPLGSDYTPNGTLGAPRQPQQQELEMQATSSSSPTSGGGWYRSEQEQQQGQQGQGRQSGAGRGGLPLGRRSGSPQRQQRQQEGVLRQPQAAAAAGSGEDSLAAALSSYGRQVRLLVAVAACACIKESHCCTQRKVLLDTSAVGHLTQMQTHCSDCSCNLNINSLLLFEYLSVGSVAAGAWARGQTTNVCANHTLLRFSTSNSRCLPYGVFGSGLNPIGMCIVRACACRWGWCPGMRWMRPICC
mgnify:CR=1 FL=1